MIARKTNIVGIFSLAYILVAIAVLSWVAYEVVVSGQELRDRVTAIADTNAKVKVYKDLAMLIGATKAERDTLAGFVLTEEETSNFLTNIESIGARQGVELTTDALKVSPQEGSFDQLLIQFGVSGKEEAVKRMLTIFETLPYQSKVASLTFNRTESGRAQSTIELSITLLKHD